MRVFGRSTHIQVLSTPTYPLPFFFSETLAWNSSNCPVSLSDWLVNPREPPAFAFLVLGHQGHTAMPGFLFFFSPSILPIKLGLFLIAWLSPWPEELSPFNHRVHLSDLPVLSRHWHLSVLNSLLHSLWDGPAVCSPSTESCWAPARWPFCLQWFSHTVAYCALLCAQQNQVFQVLSVALGSEPLDTCWGI